MPCKFLIKQIEEYVQENKTAEEIEQYIRKLCDVLPDTVTAQVMYLLLLLFYTEFILVQLSRKI